MRIALACDDAANAPRRRALAQLLLRTGLDPGAFVASAAGAGIALAWTQHPPATPGIHLPQRIDPRDRLAWRDATRAFLAEWKRAGLDGDWLFARQPDGASARHDLPMIALGLLDQWDESLSSARDEHGRFPPAESLLGGAGLLDVPVVDRMARAVARELERIAGVPLPRRQPPWGLAVTLDIDSEGMFRGSMAYRSALTAARTGPRTLARFATRGALVSARILPDPHLDMRGLCQVLEGLDARATFFVQTHRAHTLDSYELSARSPLVAALRRARLEGHEVGLHSSYATGVDGPVLERQLARLRTRVPGARPLHRAHYLRGRLDAPWRTAPIVDSSLAYGSSTGFRLGTTVPFTLEQGAFEAPPAAMDTTLRRDEELTPRAAARRVLALASEARRSGGLLTVIWHPHNLEPVLWPGWLAAMVEVVTEVRRTGGGVGPLGALAKPWIAHGRAIESTIREVLRA